MNFLNEPQLNSFKGVPPLTPTRPDLSVRAPWGGSKNLQKTMQKKTAKMEAHRDKNSGLNPNPLAPAQSKHTFPFSEKTTNFNENASIPAPFFCFLLHIFRAFSRKVTKGVEGPEPEPERDTRMEAKGVQMEPRGHKVKPQGSRKSNKSATCNPRDSKWSPRCNIGAQGPHKCKTHTKNPPK